MKKVLIIILLVILTGCSNVDVVRLKTGTTYQVSEGATVINISNDNLVQEGTSLLAKKPGTTEVQFKIKDSKKTILFEIYDGVYQRPEDEEKDDEVLDEEVISEKINNAISFLSLNELQGLYNFTVYGASKNYYYEDYKSISRFLFDDLVIDESLIKLGTKARPGTQREIKYIVIHDTGNTVKESGAWSHNNYLLSIANTTSVSWHYTIDDKAIVRNIPDNEVAWHAGDGLTSIGENGNYLGGGNKNGIGLEMAVSEGNDLIKTMQKTAKLTAYLMDKYQLDINSVNPHYAFSGKNCPQTILNAKLWDDFIEYVKAEYEAIEVFKNLKLSLKGTNIDNDGRVKSLNYSYSITIYDRILECEKDFTKN